MKIFLKRLNIRFDQAEETISKFVGRFPVEITLSERHKEKKIYYKWTEPRDLWITSNKSIYESSESPKESRKKRQKEYWEKYGGKNVQCE